MRAHLEALLILTQGRLVFPKLTDEQEAIYWSDLSFADVANELQEKLELRKIFSEPADDYEQEMLAALNELEVSIAKKRREGWAIALERVAKNSVVAEVKRFSNALAAVLRWR